MKWNYEGDPLCRYDICLMKCKRNLVYCTCRISDTTEMWSLCTRACPPMEYKCRSIYRSTWRLSGELARCSFMYMCFLFPWKGSKQFRICEYKNEARSFLYSSCLSSGRENVILCTNDTCTVEKKRCNFKYSRSWLADRCEWDMHLLELNAIMTSWSL